MPAAAHHHTAHISPRTKALLLPQHIKQQEWSSSTSTLTFLAYTLAYWILAKRPLAAPIIEDLATCGGFSTTTVESSHGAVKAIWTDNISVEHLHYLLDVNWSTFLKHIYVNNKSFEYLLWSYHKGDETRKKDGPVTLPIYTTRKNKILTNFINLKNWV